jgi:hypothetical protein
MIMNRIRIAISLLVFGLIVGGVFIWSADRRAKAAAPEIPKEPLFKFHSKQDRWFYKRGNGIPSNLSGGPWMNEGSVCYVAKDAAPGLQPIYMLVDTDSRGAFYSYSKFAHASSLFYGPGMAQNMGVEFYVAATQLPGTVPLYGFVKKVLPRDEGSKAIPGTGTYFMSLDNQAPDDSWDHRGKLGYVWTGTTHDDDHLPDLTIVKTTVRENGIEAIIRNDGKKAASGQPGVTAVLTVLDRSGKPVYFSGAKQLGGMSPGQQRPFLFETGNLDLSRKRYRVQVDAGTLVAESNENNNDTGFIEIPGPKMKINPLPAGYVQPPSITLKEAKGLGAGRMAYSFSVTNWDKFKPEWFQSLENILPPGPCGGDDTNARLIARIIVIHNSAPMPVGCKPLNSQQDLQSIVLNTPVRLGDSDRVRIFVEDRATDAKYESSAYPVGVYGVDKVLVPMGCKFFLGRASSYMCTSDQGFAACENLRQKGKPIACRRTGAQP